MSTGPKEDESSIGRVWAAVFHQCYGPLSLGARFETYEPFISLFFHFFPGRGNPRITETAYIESADTGARLYIACLAASLEGICSVHLCNERIALLVSDVNTRTPFTLYQIC